MFLTYGFFIIRTLESLKNKFILFIMQSRERTVFLIYEKKIIEYITCLYTGMYFVTYTEERKESLHSSMTRE